MTLPRISRAALPNKYARERHKELTEEARKAFATHTITRRAEGRWLLQRLYPDGKPQSNFATEIVSLWGGALYVGGDIDHVLYAYYSDTRDPVDKVAWMGAEPEVTSYLMQKASIGMGERQLTWERDEAKDILTQHYAWMKKEEMWDRRQIEACQAVLELFPYTYQEASQALCDIDCESELELRVPHPKLYYTHAALQRLLVLLGGEKDVLRKQQEMGP